MKQFEEPVVESGERCVNRREERACIPLKTASTVRKYDPMGITTMPRVKASSFMMTDLVSRGEWVMCIGWCIEGSHVGTAGAMLDFSCAAGLEPMVSSFSRRFFSWEMILRVAIVMRPDGGGQ